MKLECEISNALQCGNKVSTCSSLLLLQSNNVIPSLFSRNKLHNGNTCDLIRHPSELIASTLAHLTQEQSMRMTPEEIIDRHPSMSLSAHTSCIPSLICPEISSILGTTMTKGRLKVGRYILTQDQGCLVVLHWQLSMQSFIWAMANQNFLSSLYLKFIGRQYVCITLSWNPYAMGFKATRIVKQSMEAPSPYAAFGTVVNLNVCRHPRTRALRGCGTEYPIKYSIQFDVRGTAYPPQGRDKQLDFHGFVGSLSSHHSVRGSS